ncbi:MAG: cytochrome c [Planctomycetota bacterium]|jgi:hypothetical protein
MRHVSLVLLVLAACASPEKAPDSAEVAMTDAGTPAGLPRFKQWEGSKVVQGAQPEGDVAFRNMKALGVTTVLSVDGSIPDIEGAAKYGLVYAHIPIGYDGLTREQALQIVKAVRDSKGKVYMHCHHGKHRGPAAVMTARVALDGISNEQAVHCMEESGTSPKYAGLYRDVRAFTVPTKAELDAAPNAPSKVLPEGLRALMVDVSHRFEFLKASKIEAWKVPADNPDVSPAHEARMLWELYRESARLDESKKLGDPFLAMLKDGENAAVALEKALRANDADGAAKAYKGVKANCGACHGEYRNN